MNKTSLPAGPRSRIPGALLREIWCDPLAFLTNTQQRYGDLAGFQIGTQRIYLLSRPDFVQSVLVEDNRLFIKSRSNDYMKLILGEGILTTEGETHHRAKRLMQPAFHRERLQAYSRAMVDCATQWSGQWEARQDSAPISLRSEMLELTLAIVAKTLFNMDFGERIHSVEALINTMLPVFRRTSLPFGLWLQKLPLPGNIRFNRARRQLDIMIDDIIQEHRKAKTDQQDLLSMLLEARDEDGSPMSDAQIRDEAKTIFVAGHDAVSNTLTYALILLSQHPTIETELVRELNEVLGSRPPTLSDMPRLTSIERFVSETLRLYPANWLMARRATEDYALENYVIPRGSIVLMSPWVIHRDARFFPNPMQFDLKRWTSEARESRPRFSYFPFGGGPRSCIGEGFAWMESILVLATLIQKWRFKTTPDFRLELDPYITLRIRGNVPIHLERRRNL